MAYPDLQACVHDLEATGQLRRVEVELDPRLEIPAVQRLACAAQGPALLFTRPRGCAFPLLANLFGTLSRARYVLRHGYRAVETLIKLRADPRELLKRPWAPLALAHALPRRGRADWREISLSQLPQVVSWPRDGGAFVTLPLVYTEDPARPGWMRSNLGMYRIQLSGGEYLPEREAGMHYQLHRGIGVHHHGALERGEALRVNVWVGGPPAYTLAAVMPLPEGMPEVALAGVLAGRALRFSAPGVCADVDFCIQGEVVPGVLKPEGPFGDHLGYYSLAHDFPVLQVSRVLHRPGAIWPFTTVGRPPQEDSIFGQVIHELTGPAIPAVLPGLKEVHAVDAAGVHPLLLAVARDRYTPYAPPRRPQELLTIANAILGQGQLSLAKYLFLSDAGDVHDVAGFLQHVLQRIDLARDLHFQTETTIDTLDYSGGELHRGSKLVVACCGPPVRTLAQESSLGRVCFPGVLAVEAGTPEDWLPRLKGLEGFPLVVLVDDAAFVAESLRNFLWVVFTRFNPAVDVRGVGEWVRHKHWGCSGPLLIDARLRPYHAPPLEEDPEALRKAQSLAAPGGPLHGVY